MNSSMLTAAIAKERRLGTGYSHIMISPDDFRALGRELYWQSLCGPEPLFFAQYCLQSCDALTTGQILFHSSDNPCTLMMSTQ